MLNDFVQDEYGNIGILMSVCDNISSVIFKMRGGIVLVATKELYPIPLTTEILEKNGFMEDKAETYVKSYFFPVDKDNMSTRGFRLEVGNTTFYITDHTLMPIRYVHELQHALRLMGMSEVADNFKID